MRVLVCGSRTYIDRAMVFNVLDGMLLGHTLHCAVLGDDEEFVVIEGAAQGADIMANEWATMARSGHPLIPWGRKVEHQSYPAQWRHPTNGNFIKAAGVIRNQQMLDEGKPELVLAFTDKPLEESRGTYDMVKRADKAGCIIHVVRTL